MIIDILSCFPPRNTRKKEGGKEGRGKSKMENQIKEKDDKKKYKIFCYQYLVLVFDYSCLNF